MGGAGRIYQTAETIGLPAIERNERGTITNIKWNGDQGLLGYLIHIATTEPRSLLLGQGFSLGDDSSQRRDETPSDVLVAVPKFMDAAWRRIVETVRF